MNKSPRTLFGLVMVILIVLTAQGWTGDFVNLFAVFPVNPVSHTFSGFTQSISGAGRMEVIHAIIGAMLAILALAEVFLAFYSHAIRGVRIWSTIGLLGIFSAAYGGISFVLSGFHDSASSAQMGGSFIGTYASYFLVLCFNKK